jgi:hypothetical protein
MIKIDVDTHYDRHMRSLEPPPPPEPPKIVRPASPEGLEVTKSLEDAFAAKGISATSEEIGEAWFGAKDFELADPEHRKAWIARTVDAGIAKRKETPIEAVLAAARPPTPVQLARQTLETRLGRKSNADELRRFIAAQKGDDAKARGAHVMNTFFAKK